MLLTVVAATLLLTSCNNETDIPVYTPRGDYEGGVLVVNEGPFQNGSGTVTYVSNDLLESTDAIYKAENTEDIGNILQSMVLYGNQAFLVVNNSHKIKVVNRFTFIKEGTIDEHLVNPRYAVVVNENLYVSNWGDAAKETGSFIAVFDVNTLAFKSSIPVSFGPEKMQVIGDMIYVAHAGSRFIKADKSYEYNNIISVINSKLSTVETEIEVAFVPNSMGVDNENNLWVLCGGVPSWTGAETDGFLYKINSISDEVDTTYKFEGTHPIHLTIDGSNILYAVSSSVYKMHTSSALLPLDVYIETEAKSLYGLKASNGFLFVTDAKDYASAGSLVIYNHISKEKLNTVATGIIPSGIYFNN